MDLPLVGAICPAAGVGCVAAAHLAHAGRRLWPRCRSWAYGRSQTGAAVQAERGRTSTTNARIKLLLGTELQQTEHVASKRCAGLPKIDPVRCIGIVIRVSERVLDVNRLVRVAGWTTEHNAKVARILPSGRNNGTAYHSR